MRILLSNDDGIEAPGLLALETALSTEHEVWVVAPTTEQSAQSHSLTMHKPLRALPRGDRRWAITGTPADCIYVALHHVMRDVRPDLVFSGINNGSNLGTDVHYSGTVAAAREACLHGLQAVAISLHRPTDSASGSGAGPHFATAGTVARRIATAIETATRAGSPLRPRVFLNVNVPNRPLDALLGMKTTTLGDRFYGPLVDERRDPRGKAYLWIGGPHVAFGTDHGEDGPSVEAGYVTVTPLSAAITSTEDLDFVRSFTDV